MMRYKAQQVRGIRSVDLRVGYTRIGCTHMAGDEYQQIWRSVHAQELWPSGAFGFNQ